MTKQQDYRIFAAHSSLGWSAGERGRFEIKRPFLECRDAAPTTEPQLKGEQVAKECAAVLPGKAPSVIKTNLPCTQKPVVKAQKPAAKAKASAPSKIQAFGWQPWRSTASVLKAAFLVALVAMSGSALSGLVDAASLALAGGAQPALYANTTGDLDVVAYHPGICFDPVSNMADDPGSVLSTGDDLLHGEAVCGKLGVGSDAGGPMTKAVHAKMLRPSAPGLDGFRLLVQHKNATERMPCTPKSLPCMHHLKLSLPSISNNDGGVSSFLSAAKEVNLLASSASFASLLKVSASLAEQVPTHMHLRYHTCSCSITIFCISWLFSPAPCLHAGLHNFMLRP